MQTAGGSKKWLGLIALACAACCAVPLAAVLGIGGVTAAMGAMFAGANAETILCLAVLGALMVGGGYLLLRARRKKIAAQACATSCKSDASCCEGKPSSSAS